jgi:hypothetical protein
MFRNTFAEILHHAQVGLRLFLTPLSGFSGKRRLSRMA